MIMTPSTIRSADSGTRRQSRPPKVTWATFCPAPKQSYTAQPGKPRCRRVECMRQRKSGRRLGQACPASLSIAKSGDTENAGATQQSPKHRSQSARRSSRSRSGTSPAGSRASDNVSPVGFRASRPSRIGGSSVTQRSRGSPSARGKPFSPESSRLRADVRTVPIYMDGFWDGVLYYNSRHHAAVRVLGWNEKTQKCRFIGNFADISGGQELTRTFISDGSPDGRRLRSERHDGLGRHRRLPQRRPVLHVLPHLPVSRLRQ